MAVFAKVVPSSSDVSDRSDAAAMSSASDSKVRISGCMGDFCGCRICKHADPTSKEECKPFTSCV